MEEKARVQITIPSYQTVFNYEKRIYSFMNIVLPMSVAYSDLAYFAVTELVMILLHSILGPPALVPAGTWFVLAFVGAPAAVTKFGRKVRLDGKNTAIFIKDYIEFFFYRNMTFEGLCPIKQDDTTISDGTARWRCTYKSY